MLAGGIEGKICFAAPKEFGSSPRGVVGESKVEEKDYGHGDVLSDQEAAVAALTRAAEIVALIVAQNPVAGDRRPIVASDDLSPSSE